VRFTTASGAVYDIFEVEGEQFITRDCEKPIVDQWSGSDMAEIAAQRVFFSEPPIVGERFHYLTASHGGCVSTPVTSIVFEDTTTRYPGDVE
jgi:hypothetical protein